MAASGDGRVELLRLGSPTVMRPRPEWAKPFRLLHCAPAFRQVCPYLCRRWSLGGQAILRRTLADGDLSPYSALRRLDPELCVPAFRQVCLYLCPLFNWLSL